MNDHFTNADELLYPSRTPNSKLAARYSLNDPSGLLLTDKQLADAKQASNENRKAIDNVEALASDWAVDVDHVVATFAPSVTHWPALMRRARSELLNEHNLLDQPDLADPANPITFMQRMLDTAAWLKHLTGDLEGEHAARAALMLECARHIVQSLSLFGMFADALQSNQKPHADRVLQLARETAFYRWQVLCHAVLARIEITIAGGAIYADVVVPTNTRDRVDLPREIGDEIRFTADALGIITPQNLPADFLAVGAPGFIKVARGAIERARKILISNGSDDVASARASISQSMPCPLEIVIGEADPKVRREILEQAWSVSLATADVYAGGPQYRHELNLAGAKRNKDELIDENLPTMLQLNQKYLSAAQFDTQPPFHEWLMRDHDYHPGAYWLSFRNHHDSECSYEEFVERFFGCLFFPDWPHARRAFQLGRDFFARFRS